MKNKLFAIVLSALAVVTLGSCNDYLDKTPLDSNSDATNWTSASALETYAWNLYGDLNGYSYGSGWTRGQYHAETLTDDYSTESFTQFTQNIPASSTSWNTPYEYIRKANVLLARVDEVPGITDAVANHWRGVARFFRALHHFALVKTYGDVVWVDGEADLSDSESLQRPRDSRVTVMDNIVADLEFAVNNCYAPSVAGVNTINNLTAAALLSRVALYEGAWEKYHNVSGGHPETFYTAAKNAARKVIDSGVYSINESYKDNYTSISLAGNSEMILYMIYAVANVNGGISAKGNAIAGWSDSSTPTWGLTKSAVENYAREDGLPIHMGTYDDQTIAGVFSARDKRLSATAHPTLFPVTQMPYIEGIVSTTGYWTWKFVPLDRYAEMIGNSTWNGPSNDLDGPIFAYPEVLENYAEACAELGSCTQNDLDISVNLLRVRHGGIPALTVSGTGCSVNGTDITKDPKDPAANVLLQELRRDRRSELMGDGFRHDDLMRWALGRNLDIAQNPDGYLGASKALLQEFYASPENDHMSGDDTSWASVEEKNYFSTTGYKSPYNTALVGSSASSILNRTWDDKYYLEPIPTGQITLDENLTQNPGW